MTETEIRGDALTADVVAEAVRALNGDDLNDFYLQGAGEAHLAVAGGPEHFLVYATADNEQFLTATREADPAEIVEIVAGGQLGAFPATQMVSVEVADRAARFWLQHGRPDPSLSWEPS